MGEWTTKASLILPPSKSSRNCHQCCLGAPAAQEQLFFLYLGFYFHIYFPFLQTGAPKSLGLGRQDPEEIKHRLKLCAYSTCGSPSVSKSPESFSKSRIAGPTQYLLSQSPGASNAFEKFEKHSSYSMLLLKIIHIYGFYFFS